MYLFCLKRFYTEAVVIKFDRYIEECSKGEIDGPVMKFRLREMNIFGKLNSISLIL